MTSYILAVDPGETTGLALYNVETGDFASCELDFDKTCSYVMHMGHKFKDDLTIVAERFVITVETAKKSFQPWSLELIGVCRMTAHGFTHKELVLQGAGAAKKLASNARLSHLGWRKPSTGGHQDDAARHLLLFCANRNLLPAETFEQLVSI